MNFVARPQWLYKTYVALHNLDNMSMNTKSAVDTLSRHDEPSPPMAASSSGLDVNGEGQLRVAHDQIHVDNPLTLRSASPCLQDIRAACTTLLSTSGSDLESTMPGSTRHELERPFVLNHHALLVFATDIKDLTLQILSDVRAATDPHSDVQHYLNTLGEEKADAKFRFYLISISRVLPTTRNESDLRDVCAMTRAAIGDCVKEAIENPVTTTGRPGRPRGEAPPDSPSSMSRSCRGRSRRTKMFHGCLPATLNLGVRGSPHCRSTHH